MSRLGHINLKFRKPAPLAHVPFNHLVPNAITLLSLCAGLSAIRFAALGRWEPVLFALCFAALCDILDGRVARMLKGTSQFGAELDSLADLVSFGVAPALVLYFWALQDAGPLGWMAVVIFPCCAALRLARFNTALAAPDPLPFAGSFFTGVPTPAGAGMVIFPLVVSMGLSENSLGTLSSAHWLVIPWMILVGGLMVSRLPTIATKKLKVSRDLGIFLLLAFVFLIALLITMPWLAMTVMISAYIVSLPLSVLHYRKLHQAYLATQTGTGAGA